MPKPQNAAPLYGSDAKNAVEHRQLLELKN